MGKRNTAGGLIGIAFAALCFAAAVFLFQSHAAAGDSALFIAQATSTGR